MTNSSTEMTSNKPTIVLVHGAFADGSGWIKVIPMLEEKGFKVIAVQNPLTSLADDVAATKRVLDSQKGPIVLVGHSYGGVVISVAATSSKQVQALVYIAAFAPDVGETVGALLASMAPSSLGPAIMPDAGGFLYIATEKFQDVFAKDLSTNEARLMAVTQKPIAGNIFETPINSAAWKTIPSWYLVATEDKAINPDLERFMAKRMHAQLSEVKSSHVPFLSKPEQVADVIFEAAKSIIKRMDSNLESGASTEYH